MENLLYPLKFNPILKDKIWGGAKLGKLFGKDDKTGKLGESWELSGYEGDESVVTNGFLAGNNLTELIEIYMGDLVGDKVYENFGLSFPLLFKLIDANENLSIQVHPGDEVAMERHNSFGKTEMWYVLDADPGAELIIGFERNCDREEYLAALENDQVESLLQNVPVKKGDVFFFPAGLRIYDYKRVDDQGNERELHTDEALDVINFAASPNPQTIYSERANEINQLVTCEYFTTNLLEIDAPITRNYGEIDSFRAYMCLEGSLLIESEGGKVIVNKGETVLIPAAIDEVGFTPDQSATLLEVYL